MSDSGTMPEAGSRVNKRLVLAAVFVAALVLTAGCAGILSSSEDRSAQADKVPEDTDVMVHFDMGMLTDGDVQYLLEELDEDEAEDVDDADDIYEEFYDETGLDLHDLHQVLVFGTMAEDFEDDDEFGVLLDADWDVETVVAAIEDEEDMELVRTEHQGESVLWEPANPDEHFDPVYVGVHDDDQIVLGDREAVTASLDVSYAGANPAAGDIRDAFDEAPDGHATFAMVFPESEAGTDPIGGGFGMGMAEEMKAMSGSFYTSGGSVGVEAHVHFESSDYAEDMAGTLNLMLTEFTGEMDPEEQELVEKLDIDTSGNVLVLSWESDIDEFVDLADET